MVIMNDIKYSLIIPFWLVSILDVRVWINEVDFGIDFSSQIMSKSPRDTLKLGSRDFRELFGVG